MILDLLFKLGIPTYSSNIYTPFPATAVQQIQISKNMPKTVGRIYGISIYADSVTPDNKALITTTDATNLYITLKDGVNNFFEEVRLTDALTEFSGVPNTKPQNYLPVNIPKGMDLSTSFYINPTGIVAGANNTTILLKLWYISEESYKYMQDSGIVGINGKFEKR